MIDIKLIQDKFEILENEIHLHSNNICVIHKINWEYEKAHEFQLFCVEHVLINPKDIILIFTSHPNVLTMGRGLQKLKNSTVELIEFDPTLKSSIETEVVDIKRGGGLTFHHPGQFVFYPILKTTEHNLKVHDLMLEILSITKYSLSFLIDENNLIVNSDLLGLWFNNTNKLASIGLAVNRFVTYHGLALNFFHDQKMHEEIVNLHPCGLPGSIYSSVDKISKFEVNNESFNKFKTLFENKIYAIIERQRSSVPTLDLISSEVSFKNADDINSNTELS